MIKKEPPHFHLKVHDELVTKEYDLNVNDVITSTKI